MTQNNVVYTILEKAWQHRSGSMPTAPSALCTVRLALRTLQRQESQETEKHGACLLPTQWLPCKTHISPLSSHSVCRVSSARRHACAVEVLSALHLTCSPVPTHASPCARTTHACARTALTLPPAADQIACCRLTLSTACHRWRYSCSTSRLAQECTVEQVQGSSPPRLVP